MLYDSIGDTFIVCLEKSFIFLKARPAVSSPVKNDLTIPLFITRTEFALTPLSEEGDDTGAAIRSWEGVYQSVTVFFKARQDQRMPMPAVSVYTLFMVYTELHACMSTVS